MVNLYPSVNDQFHPASAETFADQQSIASAADDLPTDCDSTSSSDESEVIVSLPSDNSSPLDSNESHQETEMSNEMPVGLRRSSRIRQRPERLNSVDYNSDIPFGVESEVTENWWPNFPRGTWNPSTSESI